MLKRPHYYLFKYKSGSATVKRYSLLGYVISSKIIIPGRVATGLTGVFRLTLKTPPYTSPIPYPRTGSWWLGPSRQHLNNEVTQSEHGICDILLHALFAAKSGTRGRETSAGASGDLL